MSRRVIVACTVNVIAQTQQRWRTLKTLFFGGAFTNWIAVGVLAWEPRHMAIVAVLFAIGSGAMFVAAVKGPKHD